MNADDYPPMHDISVMDPVTGESMREGFSVAREKLEAMKSDLRDQYPGCEFVVRDHVPDVLDIPTFLRRNA